MVSLRRIHWLPGVQREIRPQQPHANSSGWRSRISDKDIQTQTGLGVGLLPLGTDPRPLWFWYASRGAYRLAADTLHLFRAIRPCRLVQLREVDKSKWDRKGIAYVDYQLSDGKRRQLQARRLCLRTQADGRDPRTHRAGTAANGRGAASMKPQPQKLVRTKFTMTELVRFDLEKKKPGAMTPGFVRRM